MLVACGGGAPATPPAQASSNAQFASASAAPDSSSLGAAITFREVGLRPGAVLNLVATADGTAHYTCAGAAGRLGGPSLPVTGQVSALRTLRADSAGELTASLELSPAPPSGIECATGLHVLATSARYERIELSDVTDRVQVDIDGEVDVP